VNGSPSIFSPAGVGAGQIASLGWLLTIIAAAIVVIIGGLLIAALLRPRPDRSTDVMRGAEPAVATRWIIIGGLVVPAFILLGAFVATVLTGRAVASPPTPPVATIEVTAHRWWWEIRYRGATADLTVLTANEIHVPVGGAVRIDLSSADVIHSFWVPQLAAKTDLIPGQTNTMWIEARAAGVYRGECAEYCGLQHAQMNFVVVAESPAAFQAWLAHQREPASPPTDSLARLGQAGFAGHQCAVCHAIAGTDNLGRIGPDLTHLASRRMIGAGLLDNTPANLERWVVDAPSLKPGIGMPAEPIPLAGRAAVIAYLETLR